MADMIKIPGLGEVPKTAAIVVGGGAAAFVGYKWWRSRSAASTAAPAIVDPNNPGTGNVPATGQNAPASGNSTVNATIGQPLTTNAAWTQAAIEYLAGIGYDATTVAAAIGDYLDRQPLTTAEQTIIRTAVGVEGPPPEGGPYPIAPVLGGSSSPPVTRPTHGGAIYPLPGKELPGLGVRPATGSLIHTSAGTLTGGVHGDTLLY